MARIHERKEEEMLARVFFAILLCAASTAAAQPVITTAHVDIEGQNYTYPKRDFLERLQRGCADVSGKEKQSECLNLFSALIGTVNDLQSCLDRARWQKQDGQNLAEELFQRRAKDAIAALNYFLREAASQYPEIYLRE